MTHILLPSDEGDPGRTALKDEDIAKVVGVHVNTVEKVRRRCVLESIERALERNEQENRRPRKRDGTGEARLVAGSCGDQPDGWARWTLRLLADRLAELEIVNAIAAETAGQTLEKAISSRRRSSIAAIPN